MRGYAKVVSIISRKQGTKSGNNTDVKDLTKSPIIYHKRDP
jgi:hypothetical protein